MHLKKKRDGKLQCVLVVTFHRKILWCKFNKKENNKHCSFMRRLTSFEIVFHKLSFMLKYAISDNRNIDVWIVKFMSTFFNCLYTPYYILKSVDVHHTYNQLFIQLTGTIFLMVSFDIHEGRLNFFFFFLCFLFPHR